MLLKRISIKNFRAIKQANILVGSQLALIGGNGTGKSTVLRALDKFYGPSTSLEMDDFFAKRPGETEIALTFGEFNADEIERFASRIHNEEMTVARVFDPELGRASGSYFGVTRQHRAFVEIRRLAAGDRRAAYSRLREGGGIYSDLPAAARAAADIEPQMHDWEVAHPAECELVRDDGRFFGFTNVANGALQRSTAFVFIPAVRDVSADAQDSKGAVVSKLLDLVVKNVVQQREDFRTWKERISNEYRAITDPEALPELGNLGEALTATLRAYYHESAVELN